MGKIVSVLVVLVMVILPSFKPIFEPKPLKKYHLPAGLTSADYLPSTLIVKFKNVSLGKSTLSVGSRQFNGTTAVTITSINPIYQFKGATLQTLAEQKSIDNAGLNRIYQVKYNSSLPIEKVVDELQKDASVEYVEPSFVYYTFDTPNDPDFLDGKQSYLDQVKAPEAWTIQPNANKVVIAIVDSGSDLQHADLAGNIYLNSSDPVNGIDDDGDGYIDNYMGWDFVGATASKIVADNNPDIPADSLDHGVHVSGLASAVSNNGLGIASIAENAKLMIIKVGADDNSRAIYKGYEGIIYAANHGAKIINCSWGGPGGGAYGQDVVNYVVSKGCLVVAAAGNSKTNEPIYPAAYSGAFAVANVTSDDVKASSSSFGYHVAIAAPGTGIYSTTNGNNYGYKSGTSMAAPIVSSAAALVLAKNPLLTGLQAGEILRITADDIYINKVGNELYTNQLGSGRLNVFKAVSASSSPSIRYQKITIDDGSSGALSAGDTVSYYFELKNILLATNNLEVSLSTDNPNIKIVTGLKNVGAFNALETKSVGPFKVVVNANTPENTNILFKLNYSNPLSNYNAKEFFTSTVNLDYQNITVNQLYTTISSNGRIGYSGANAHDGLGVLYKDFSMLYEGALMIGVSPTQVSNNARSANGETDEDFFKVKGVARVQDAMVAYEGISTFNDSKSVSPIGLLVNHKQIAYKNAPDDKFVVVEYEVTNTTNLPLNNVYIGLFADWDIDESSKNFLAYDEEKRLSYAYASTPLTPYAGIQVLSTNVKPLFYPLSYQLGSDPLYDGNFSTTEKYHTLSSGIKATNLGTGDGLDIMCVIGAGPYIIAPGKSVKIAFAVIVGDDLADIQKSAMAASEKYTKSLKVVESEFKMSQNYPNPAKKLSSVDLNIPDNGFTSLEVFDYLGRKVKDVLAKDLKQGVYTTSIDLSGLKTGVYFYRCTFKGQQKVHKMIVVE
ncbi:S8/S53 family peptidase [Pedobacter arcticus]|uniref:S8/S53 family peptidase n=1 Tax=Pedobacter arcticus TaxID=752140 RepID=UPI0002F98E07|nr:S8/S53 family peptidase [Pedobacter arcticus]